MKFSYKAVTTDGKIVRGVLEAKDKGEAVIYLRNRNLLPINIGKAKDSDILNLLPFINKARSFDLVFFTRQLSSMISSGLTLVQSLNVLKEQSTNPYMTGVVTNIITDIEGGLPFSKSIEKYPDIFSQVYVSLIKAAEVSGLFDKVLLRLADNLEKQQKLKQSIRSALLYPAIVIIGMIVVAFIMTLFVVPQFTALYKSLNVALPLPTVIVIAISHFMIAFWPLIIGLTVLVIYLFRRWHKTPSGKLFVDTTVLKLPVFGKLISESILTEFTRTLGVLVGSGTLIVESLNQTAQSAGNVLYKNAILGVAQRVEKGLSMGDSLSSYPLFPPILIQMAKIGEQTGKLDESLLRVSDYFEREVDQMIKTLTTLMEPFIIVVLGIGVAFLIISVITPIYSLIGAIQ